MTRAYQKKPLDNLRHTRELRLQREKEAKAARPPAPEIAGPGATKYGTPAPKVEALVSIDAMRAAIANITEGFQNVSVALSGTRSAMENLAHRAPVTLRGVRDAMFGMNYDDLERRVLAMDSYTRIDPMFGVPRRSDAFVRFCDMQVSRSRRTGLSSIVTTTRGRSLDTELRDQLEQLQSIARDTFRVDPSMLFPGTLALGGASRYAAMRAAQVQHEREIDRLAGFTMEIGTPLSALEQANLRQFFAGSGRVSSAATPRVSDLADAMALALTTRQKPDHPDAGAVVKAPRRFTRTVGGERAQLVRQKDGSVARITPTNGHNEGKGETQDATD